MKYFFDNVIFFILFFFVEANFPEWNFENASFNLLNETNNYRYSYIIYNKDVSNYELTLSKTIYKEGSEIKDENNLDIVNKNNNNEKFSVSVNWEDINNIIFYNNILHICPKGVFHPYYYNNQTFNTHSMYNFPTDVSSWDLKCFIYDDLLIAIYSGNDFLFSYNPDLNGWTKINIDFELNDLLWNKLAIIDDTNYQLPGLTISQDNTLALSKLNFLLDFSIGLGIESYKNITKGLQSNFLSYFDENSHFYFLSHNNEKILSGYYNEVKEITVDNIENINPVINTDFDLEQNNIQNINVIKDSRYSYYEIDINSKIYYGIFDIITNQILFNTNEAIKKYIPFSKYSMLAITDNSAYEICIISVDGKCIEKCDNDDIIINTKGKNYCKCPKYYFIPSYKCIDTCDLNFYINVNNQCGLCKDLGGNKIYKLINTTGCLEEIPDNTIFYDEDSFLLTCDENSYLENETCVSYSHEEEEEEEKEKENKEGENDDDKSDEIEVEEDIDFIVWIFIASVSVVFIIISFIICKKLWSKSSKIEDDLLNQIDTDFEPKNSPIN